VPVASVRTRGYGLGPAGRDQFTACQPSLSLLLPGLVNRSYSQPPIHPNAGFGLLTSHVFVCFVRRIDKLDMRCSYQQSETLLLGKHIISNIMAKPKYDYGSNVLLHHDI
jgi:hypothetical protein